MDILSDVNVVGKIFLGNKNVFINSPDGCTINFNAYSVIGTSFHVQETIDCPDIHTNVIRLCGGDSTQSLKFESGGIRITDGNKSFTLSDLAKRPPYGQIEYISVPAKCSKFVVSQSEFYAPLVQAYKQDGKQVEMDYAYDDTTGNLIAELNSFSEATSIMFRII